MSSHELSYRHELDCASVYTLTDRQLADEYSRLTGAWIQVPSSRNCASWWQWRNDLQEKVRKERLSQRTWYFAP